MTVNFSVFDKGLQKRTVILRMVPDCQFLLVYASQTGQAKAIAEEFNEVTLNEGLSPRMHCISQTEKEFCLEKVDCAVFIVSSTGEGEPPETAMKFWRKLKRPALPKDHLAHLNFTVLGLGDSNYTNFCNFGKMLNRRLEELGGKHFCASTWADDGVGLEVVVEPWKQVALESLKQHLQTAGNQVMTEKMTDSLLENITKEMDNSCVISSAEQVKELSIKDNETLPQLDNRDLDNGDVSRTIPSETFVCSDKDQRTIIDSESHIQNDNSSGIISAETDSHDGQPTVHSLTCSTMSDIPLTLPLCPPRFLNMSFLTEEKKSDCRGEGVIKNNCSFPGARSPLSLVKIKSVKKLTHDDAVKTTLQIDLDISSCGWSYEPGDTIAVICPNSTSEVNSLILRLDLTQFANVICCLEVLPDTRKRNAQVPEFLPQKSTLFEILQTCCEIRETPRKAFLRALTDFTEDVGEKRRLQELCSKQGADDYAKFVRGPNLSLMDILSAFPSCTPPIEVVLENLPRLQPRAYSASSSPLSTPGCIQFVFNVLHFAVEDGRSQDRDGVCTGWLNDITKHLQNSTPMINASYEAESQSRLAEECLKVPIFLRTNRFFRLPSDLSVPLVMIGPGTGVAPFVGFLQHRSKLVAEASDVQPPIGETWLFYGCRNRNLDFLFKEELEGFVAAGVLTKLLVSHSRDASQPSDSARYVQDNIKIFGEELVNLIHNRNAQVYICGDAKGMSPDVYKTFNTLLQLYKGMDEKTAEAYLTAMRAEKRYLEDVWV